jgi:hypothetical protein
MNLQEIKSFIDNFKEGKQSYENGVSLFFDLSGKKVVKETLLKIGSNQSNIQYLINFFNQYVQEHEPPPVPEPQISITSSIHLQPSIHYPSAEVSTFKEKFYEDWKLLYKQRGHLHGRLHEAATDNLRYEIAKEIMEVQHKIESMNKQKEEVDNGIVPHDYLKVSASAEVFSRVKNLKVYIQRETKKLDQETDPAKRAKIENRIKKFNSELERL